MEAILALGTILLANLAALVRGVDSRDGRDWQPRLPVPRPPAPCERRARLAR